MTPTPREADVRATWDSKEWEQLLARVQSMLASEAAPYTRSEFSPSAVMLMLAAMQISFHKYGAVADGYPQRVNAIGLPDQVDRRVFGTMGSFGKRLSWYFFGERDADGEQYIAPGNVEYLVDAMNFLMIEFMRPAHPQAHYTATDKDGSPGRVARHAMYDGEAMQFKNTDIESAA